LHKAAIMLVLLRRLAGSSWDAGTMLRIATLALVHSQQSTALISGVAVLTPTSLTLPSTKPCELWLDACVPH